MLEWVLSIYLVGSNQLVIERAAVYPTEQKCKEAADAWSRRPPSDRTRMGIEKRYGACHSSKEMTQ